MSAFESLSSCAENSPSVPPDFAAQASRKARAPPEQVQEPAIAEGAFDSETSGSAQRPSQASVFAPYTPRMNEEYNTSQNTRQSERSAVSGRRKSIIQKAKSFMLTSSNQGGSDSCEPIDEQAEEERKKKKKGIVRKIRKAITRELSGKNRKSTVHRPNLAPADRVRIKTGNANKPFDYTWLEEPLVSLASNKAKDLGSIDAQTQKPFTPLFFVIGGCPNYFCGMQVIAYFISSGDDAEVDFWWVKPVKGSTTETEHATLCRQAKGLHKNDPGRSKPFYKPLADMFSEPDGHVAEDGRRFAIEPPPGETCLRAFIEEDNAETGNREKLWLHLVWQEDWTSSPFSSSKYIKGKIVYQRSANKLEFFSREYCIRDGVFSFSVFEDAPFNTVLPADSIKELYEGATDPPR